MQERQPLTYFYAVTHMGEIIPISSLYSTIDGMQINIDGNIEVVRKLSREGKLFYPCGCGTRLVLVAATNQTRRQHFRSFRKNPNGCHYIKETSESIISKTALKCWMNDKLKVSDIEYKKAICKIEENDRRYQFILFSPSKKIAVSYCRKGSNISDSKISTLEDNESDVKTVYVTDSKNAEGDFQYPEYLIKFQKVQKYCLLLSVDENGLDDYSSAELEAMFYAKDAKGLWKKISLTRGKLSDYNIADDGSVIYRDTPILSLYEKELKRHEDSVQREKEEAERRAEEKRIRDEELRLERERQLEEERRLREEQEKIREQKRLEREALLEQKRREAEEERKKQQAIQEKLRKEQEKAEAERKRIQEMLAERIRIEEEQRKQKEREEEAKKAIWRQYSEDKKAQIMSDAINTSNLPAVDITGTRCAKCSYCGVTTPADKFPILGEISPNLGVCKNCRDTNPKFREDMARLRGI